MVVLIVFLLQNKYIINIGIVDEKIDRKYEENIVLYIFASTLVHWVEIY